MSSVIVPRPEDVQTLPALTYRVRAELSVTNDALLHVNICDVELLQCPLLGEGVQLDVMVTGSVFQPGGESTSRTGADQTEEVTSFPMDGFLEHYSRVR